jgi:hypothetical protein
MKKIVLITLVIMQFSIANAQISVYKPFPSKMVKVARSYTDFSSGATPISKTYRTEISGDTILNGLKYSKIYAIESVAKFWGGIRNDIPNKKVYQYKLSTGQEKLLYDFNLLVGDTLFKDSGYGFYDILGNATDIGVGWGFEEYIDTAWVSSIDSVLMKYDGEYHKRFNFATKVKPPGYNKHILINSGDQQCFPSASDCRFKVNIRPLVEGVGQVYNPVSYASFMMSHIWEIGPSCFTFNGIEGIATIPGECKSFLTGMTEENNPPGVEIYPNPSNGKFQLIFKEQSADEIEVMDVLGKRVYKFTIKNGMPDIDISDEVRGIYFLKLKYKNGDVMIKKIIKE